MTSNTQTVSRLIHPRLILETAMALLGMVTAAHSAPLSLLDALALANVWAAEVNTGTLLAFARHESGLDPNVIHDNTTGQTFHLSSASTASALAAQLLKQGHSLDLGIMQVNSNNMARTGLNVQSAFDPGQSIRAGSQILVAAFQQCSRHGTVESQAALRCAASVYNTGNEQDGILNGYQAKVWRVAALIVPAIRTAAAGSESPAFSPDDVVAPQPRPRPAPPAFEDALHPAPPLPSDDDQGMTDAIHPSSKD